MVIDMATSAFGVGSTLFYPNSPFHDTIVVKENISCADPMEASYAALVKFPPVCYYCGKDEGLVTEGVAELKRSYGVVRPLCCICQSKGKTNKVSHPNNVKRRQVE